MNCDPNLSFLVFLAVPPSLPFALSLLFTQADAADILRPPVVCLIIKSVQIQLGQLVLIGDLVCVMSLWWWRQRDFLAAVLSQSKCCCF